MATGWKRSNGLVHCSEGRQNLKSVLYDENDLFSYSFRRNQEIVGRNCEQFSKWAPPESLH